MWEREEVEVEQDALITCVSIWISPKRTISRHRELARSSPRPTELERKASSFEKNEKQIPKSAFLFVAAGFERFFSKKKNKRKKLLVWASWQEGGTTHPRRWPIGRGVLSRERRWARPRRRGASRGQPRAGRHKPWRLRRCCRKMPFYSISIKICFFFFPRGCASRVERGWSLDCSVSGVKCASLKGYLSSRRRRPFS